jgi:hypothetical protein
MRARAMEMRKRAIARNFAHFEALSSDWRRRCGLGKSERRRMAGV